MPPAASLSCPCPAPSVVRRRRGIPHGSLDAHGPTLHLKAPVEPLRSAVGMRAWPRLVKPTSIYNNPAPVSATPCSRQGSTEHILQRAALQNITQALSGQIRSRAVVLDTAIPYPAAPPPQSHAPGRGIYRALPPPPQPYASIKGRTDITRHGQAPPITHGPTVCGAARPLRPRAPSPRN